MVKKIFNAKELRRYERADGSLMHIELQIDDTIIMMGSSTKEYSPIRLMTHLYVPNVDETFEKALECGYESIQNPTEKEGDEDKRGGIKDFAGNDWWISTQLNN